MKCHLQRGFTLVELLVVLAILGLLAAVAVPNILTARTTVQRRVCLSNLKQIEEAKQLWALANKKGLRSATIRDSDLFGADKYLKRRPVCPRGGVYSLKTLQRPATCSIPGHTLAK